MRALFRANLPFLRFLGVFFGSYLGMSWLYDVWLDQYLQTPGQLDSFTNWANDHVMWVLQHFDHSAKSLFVNKSSGYWIFYHGKYVARIIEGCNAMRVMILFSAFVVAFRGPLKTSILFISVGIFSIHLLNIGRIAALSIALSRFPEFETALHDIAFPLFIYGCVFILWIVWVNKWAYGIRKN
ncbi:MAG: exosortase family protein XrtF [Flavobacterium sp. BFFFF2]|nr:MAG: exosortase family protein XrtF [Flavobacterium sp. BFFFF2]